MLHRDGREDARVLVGRLTAHRDLVARGGLSLLAQDGHDVHRRAPGLGDEQQFGGPRARPAVDVQPPTNQPPKYQPPKSQPPKDQAEPKDSLDWVPIKPAAKPKSEPEVPLF
mgnify:CR=1 FL=1